MADCESSFGLEDQHLSGDSHLLGSPGIDLTARYHHLYDTQTETTRHVDGAPRLVKRNKLLDVETRIQDHTAELMTPGQETRRLIANNLIASLTVEISSLQASLAEQFHDAESTRAIEAEIVNLKDLRRKAVLSAPAASVPPADLQSEDGKMPVLA